jgi:hypothetical protein
MATLKNIAQEPRRMYGGVSGAMRNLHLARKARRINRCIGPRRPQHW